MPLGVFLLISWMGLVTLMTIGFIYMAVAGGQFKDIEEPKYRMLLDQEPQPWPGRENPEKDTQSMPKDGASGEKGGEHGSERA